MKVTIILAIVLSILTVQAEESAKGISFSSKKEVEEEIGPEKRVELMAQPSLARFVETGVMDGQAQAALAILSQKEENKGKSLERMAIDSIKANFKK